MQSVAMYLNKTPGGCEGETQDHTNHINDAASSELNHQLGSLMNTNDQLKNSKQLNVLILQRIMRDVKEKMLGLFYTINNIGSQCKKHIDYRSKEWLDKMKDWQEQYTQNMSSILQQVGTLDYVSSLNQHTHRLIQNIRESISNVIQSTTLKARSLFAAPMKPNHQEKLTARMSCIVSPQDSQMLVKQLALLCKLEAEASEFYNSELRDCSSSIHNGLCKAISGINTLLEGHELNRPRLGLNTLLDGLCSITDAIHQLHNEAYCLLIVAAIYLPNTQRFNDVIKRAHLACIASTLISRQLKDKESVNFQTTPISYILNSVAMIVSFPMYISSIASALFNTHIDLSDVIKVGNSMDINLNRLIDRINIDDRINNSTQQYIKSLGLNYYHLQKAYSIIRCGYAPPCKSYYEPSLSEMINILTIL